MAEEHPQNIFIVIFSWKTLGSNFYLSTEWAFSDWARSQSCCTWSWTCCRWTPTHSSASPAPPGQRPAEETGFRKSFKKVTLDPETKCMFVLKNLCIHCNSSPPPPPKNISDQKPEKRHTARLSGDWHLWARADEGWTVLLLLRLGPGWNV